LVDRFFLFAGRFAPSLRASTPPPTSGAVAPYGAAIMAPSLGATNTSTVRHRRTTGKYFRASELGETVRLKSTFPDRFGWIVI
jgi:hypothetical protein